MRTFLLGIARNQCRNRWRKLASEVELEEDNDVGAAQGALDAIAALPALQREALFLFEYEGLGLEPRWRRSTPER